MTIRQGRYIVAETEQEKKVRVTEIQRAEEDPFIRRSEVQQKVNSSTLPVSSRAVNLVIDDKIESGDLASKQYVDQKFNSIDLSSYASITYVDEKFNSIDLSKYLTIEKANQTYSTKAELTGKWDVQETVGNSSGKVMREGAYGLGVNSRSSKIFDFINGEGEVGFYDAPKSSEGNPLNENGVVLNLNRGVTSGGNWGMFLIASDNSDRIVFRRQLGGSQGEVGELLHTLNTSLDSNGVLQIGTGTPIDTLNTSDMADTVVDNDMLTVTSGAVFRAIKQLTDQIISLEARVRELEDGGV